jgi:hypothetical protein
MTVANGLQEPPSAVRNSAPILDVLSRVLSAFTGKQVLEIAAGSGYHAATFARALPHLTWQPTDADANARESIAAYVRETALPNLQPPLALDVCGQPWPVAFADAVVCINMIHISPWEATVALFSGAQWLGAKVVVTYGPYSIAGDFLADSNIAFDQSLRQRNPLWGIRDVTDVAKVAGASGFRLEDTIRMPANNLALIFRA